jgi:hypothetical protein
MPRRRTRKTNWKPQDERRLRVRSVRRGTPDARKLSRAFISLALAQAEAKAELQQRRRQRNASDSADEDEGDTGRGGA